MNASIASLERRDGLAHNLRRMVEETENFLQAAAQTGDEKFMTIRGQLAEQVRNMRWQLDELEDNAVHKARRAARVADQTIGRIAVGTPVTGRPPHRSQRAQLTHWAPTSGV
jgi:ElaB/YqjD/DUF883 family membrane-anchored ribosome-binding protein